MKRVWIAALLAGSAMASAQAAQENGYSRTDGGVVVTPTGGSAAKVEVTVHGDGIFHVIATPRGIDTARSRRA